MIDLDVASPPARSRVRQPSLAAVGCSRRLQATPVRYLCNPMQPVAPVDTAATSHSTGHRTLALLFSDLSRSTQLSQAMEPEDYGLVLLALRRCFQHAVEGRGGTVVRMQGDGLLAIFGLPVAHEHDALHAVDAALDLRAALRPELIDARLPDGFALAVHSGVHAGRVYIVPGDVERGRYDLIGPVANLTARVASAAAAGEVLASRDALGPFEGYFDGEARLLTPEGSAEPLPVLAIRGRAREGTRHFGTQRQRAPTMGREVELDALLGALRPDAPPRTEVITAAAGSGKTRLLDELALRAAAAGAQVLRGSADNAPGTLALAPMRALLALGGEMTLDTGTTGSLLLQAQRIASALRPPTLITLDDWQWTDDASRSLLAALLPALPFGVLVVLALRDDDQAYRLLPGAHHRHLPPLDPAAARATVAHLLPQADPFVAEEIVARAGGVPLFIEEFCLLHQRRTGRTAPALPTGVAWLDRLLEARLEPLPATQLSMLRAAAVIGMLVPAPLLAAVLSFEPQPADLAALVAHDFLQPDPGGQHWRFKHALTRDVLYRTIGLHERQALHRRVAAALRAAAEASAGELPLEALAHHLAAGGEPLAAAPLAELAGDRAAAASAMDRARLHYRSALAALDAAGLDASRQRQWLSIAHRLGLVCVFDASRTDLPLFERAAVVADRLADPAQRARSRYWLGFMRYSLGDPRAAIIDLDTCLLAAREAADEPLAVQAVATLGQVHSAAAHYTLAMPLLDEAIAVKSRHRRGKRLAVGLAYTLVCRACVLADRGDFEAGLACLDEAWSCTADLTHQIGATVTGWRGAVLLWQGRWQEALAASQDSGRIAEATHSLYQLSIAHAQQGAARWHLGDGASALRSIEEATVWVAPQFGRSVGAASQGGLFFSLVHGWAAEAHAQAGHSAALRLCASRALGCALRRDLLGAAMSCRALARDALARGEPTRAARWLRRAGQIAVQRESAHEAAHNKLLEAELQASQGRQREADAALASAQAAYARLAMTWHAEAAAAVRRRLGL